jgi:hypothetical protein
MGCYFCGQEGQAARAPGRCSARKSRPYFRMRFLLSQGISAQSHATANQRLRRFLSDIILVIHLIREFSLMLL